MKDFIPKGTGNSRWMKSSIPTGTTWEEALAMLRAGTFPFDLNGINDAGVAQIGMALNAANLFSGDTQTNYPDGVETPNNALALLSKAALFRGGYTQTGLNNWTETENSEVDRSPNRFAYNGLVALAGDLGNGTVWRSYDQGRTWETFSVASGSQYYVFTVHDNLIYAVNSGNATIIHTSTDGMDWNAYSSYSGLSGKITYAWFYNDTLCTLATDYQTILSVGSSYNATLPYAASIMMIKPLIVDGTIYFLPASGNQLMYSTDGKTWKTRTLPASINWGCMAYKDGVFVASCRSGSYGAYYSTDAVNWYPGPARTTGDNTVIAGEKYFILPTSKKYSPDGKTWYSYSPNIYPVNAYFGYAFDDVISVFDYTSPRGFYWATEEEVIPPMLTDVLGNPLTLSNAKVTYGSYVGNGLCGSSNPTKIQLESDPVFICVISSGGFSVHIYGPNNLIIWQPGVESQSMDYDGSRSTYISISYNQADKIFSYYSANPSGYNSAAAQLNSVGSKYYYVAVSVG